MGSTHEYDFQLPKELIAQEPVANRSDARMMVVHRATEEIEHLHVRDLPHLLNAPDALVLNDSRVIPARLEGYRANTRGRWTGLFLGADATGHWQLVCKTRGRLQPGERIMLVDRQRRDRLGLQLVTRLDDRSWVARPDEEGAPLELLETVGRVPLPNYIRRGVMVEQDVQRYQTVFASRPGSVAAPTAGLHFTPLLLAELKKSGVTVCHVTLHVGLGTFQPIKTDELAQHRMHAEWCELDEPTASELNRCRAAGGRIVAVGSTAARTLETAAASGVLQQWSGPTDLFIRPGHQFHAVDAMLTNFHLPRSTLLVLVRTFGGDELIRRAYGQAIEQGYRFFSYGDAMLIL